MRRAGKYSLVILLLSLVAALLLLLLTNWGLSLALWVSSALLPGKLDVQAHDGNLIGPIHLTNLRYQEPGLAVQINQLDLDWDTRALLSGEMDVKSLTVDTIELRISESDSAPDQAVADANNALVLPIAILLRQATIAQVKIYANEDPEPVILDNLALSANTDGQDVAVKDLQVQAFDMQLRASGKVELKANIPMHLQAKYRYQIDDTHVLQSSGSIEGDLKKLAITQQFTGPVQAELKGSVSNILDALNWEAAIHVQQLKSHALLAEGPNVAVTGHLRVRGDLDKLSMQGALDLNEKQIGVAKVDVDAQTVFTSMHYQFTMQGSFTGVDLPPGKANVQGAGDLQQVNLSHFIVQTLGGEVNGEGAIRWSPQFTLNTTLTARDIQPEALSQEWPGRLNANMSIKSVMEKASPRFVFDLEKLHGELRGYPVKAQARGNWYKDTLNIDDLDLSIEQSKLALHGKLSEQWDIQFSAASPDLKQLLPDAGGSFELSGRVRGNRAAPHLVLSGSGEGLAYARDSVQSLRLQLDLGLGSTSPLQVDIQAQNMVTRLGKWQQMKLQTTGDNQAHELALQLSSDTEQYATLIDASFSPWQWQGKIAQLNITQKDVGAWTLKAPVAFSLKAGGYEIQPLCIAQNGAYLCSEINWRNKGGYARLEGKAMPLELLQPWLPTTIKMSGQVELLAELHAANDALYSGDLSVQSTANGIVVEFTELNERLSLAASEFKANFDQQGLQANLQLPLTEGGGLAAGMQLPGWSPLHAFSPKQALQARLQLDRVPADAITRFIPELARTQGYLQGDFHVLGTLEELQLQGKADWREGHITLPELGVSMQDIELQLHSQQTNILAFNLVGHF